MLATRLWSGLSGRKLMLAGTVVSPPGLLIAGVLLDEYDWPTWLMADPARLTPLAWLGAILVVAKYGIAARAWRDVSPGRVRAYLFIWCAGTVTFLALGLVVWNVMRIYVPFDPDRMRSVIILLALLGMPLARVGLAPITLARNRHRA
jgi:hypothetical protein